MQVILIFQENCFSIVNNLTYLSLPLIHIHPDIVGVCHNYGILQTALLRSSLSTLNNSQLYDSFSINERFLHPIILFKCFKRSNPITSWESVAVRPRSEKCLAYSSSSSSQGKSSAMRSQRLFSFKFPPNGKSSGNRGSVLRSL